MPWVVHLTILILQRICLGASSCNLPPKRLVNYDGWLTTSMIHKLYTNYIYTRFYFGRCSRHQPSLKCLFRLFPFFAENFHLEVMEAGLLGEAFVPETCFKTKLGGRRMDSGFLCFSNTHIQWYRYLIRVLQRIISHMVSNDIKGLIYSKWYNSCFHQQYFSLSWLSSAFSGKMNL